MLEAGSVQTGKGKPGSCGCGRPIDRGVGSRFEKQSVQALESHVLWQLFSAAREARADRQARWRKETIGHTNGLGPHRASGRQRVPRTGVGEALSSRLIWVSAWKIGIGGRRCGAPALLAARLGARSRYPSTLTPFRTSYFYERSGNTRTVRGCCCTSSGGSKPPCSWRMAPSNLERRAVHKGRLYHLCWLICSFIGRLIGGW